MVVTTMSALRQSRRKSIPSIREQGSQQASFTTESSGIRTYDRLVKLVVDLDVCGKQPIGIARGSPSPH